MRLEAPVRQDLSTSWPGSSHPSR